MTPAFLAALANLIERDTITVVGSRVERFA
jgi:hypothetical protein